ncbi:MAG: hypothetical protein NUV80_05765, partial [Candidatus Berkelbacteria bacterium]|nr:hypothetical protein [Candidatus Berkelbacteria bacterium]
MAFTISTATPWLEELAGRQDLILKPILGSRFMDYITDKRQGITGQSVLLPNLESTTPAQAGTACGFTSSGITTITQTTITTVPIKVQEQLCLQDMETYFAQQWLPGTSQPETFEMLDAWVQRKLAQIARRAGQTFFQGKTSYTNDSWLKQFNGFLAISDTAATATAATQQASITTSTVRGIFEDMIFVKSASIPAILDKEPIIYCGQDTFMILVNKLMVDNLFHFAPNPAALGTFELIYPGTNIKVVGLPEMNASNGVETGVLATAVKNRIIMTYRDNFVVGFNTLPGAGDFKVWYSQDDQVLKFAYRAHMGAAIKHNDLVVQYTNS